MRPLFVLLLIPALCRAEPVDFDKTIAPILANRCLDCHSGAEAKGKLDLSSAKSFTKSAVVVAGKPAESPLWQKIEADEMPPKHPLPVGERKVLKEWIESGAKWGTETIDAFRFSTSHRAGYDWWSVQPVKRTHPPGKIPHPIDAYIRAKLNEKKLQPSPAADRRTLIRRLSYDLLGLPPTPEEVEKFANDNTPEAYEKLVDRLLASPHYGERWARHWLDVARFGESDGYEFDRMRPNAWRYRNWVIEALNADMPYDRFTKLQIAGDVLEPNNPGAIVATGFLVGGAHDSLMPAGDALRQLMRQDELEDIVGTVSQTFLGMTVNCARCHDHKFDPIRQTDYYRIASALAGVRRGERPLPATVSPELITQLETLRKQLAAIEEPAKAKIRGDRAKGVTNRPAPPKPYAAWDFSRDLRDTVGNLHGKAVGNAKIVDGALRLDGKSHVVAGPIPENIKERTLEVWAKLDTLDQRGGAAMSVQSPDGGLFDAIVFGEKQPKQWLSGSNFFARTQPFDGPVETVTKEYVHVAISYANDGTITAYRNGKQYGKSYKVEKLLNIPKAHEFQILFGLRHSPPAANKQLTGSILRANFYTKALTAEEIALSSASPDFVSEVELTQALTAEQRTTRQTLLKDISDLSGKLSQYRDAKTFAITPAQPPPTHLLKRGNPAEKGELLAPGGLSVFKDSDFDLKPDAPEAERRKKLAEWIASERNPLFARVMVNRIWQYHFGKGLIETSNDLGFNGGTPSHPELLDWLATEFVKQKWSLKSLHRMMVMSETYQQASVQRVNAMKVDAENKLLWRYTPRRLDAESLRDSILSVSGQLNTAVGGRGYLDFRPFLHRSSQYYEIQDPVGAEFNRRSIYRMIARGGRNPLLDTFDCPDPSTTSPNRGNTTTPQQALTLLNNSFTLRMSDHLAERLKKEAGNDVDKQIRLGIALTYGRPAKDAEVTASRDLVNKHGLAPFCRALLNTNGFLYVH